MSQPTKYNSRFSRPANNQSLLLIDGMHKKMLKTYNYIDCNKASSLKLEIRGPCEQSRSDIGHFLNPDLYISEPQSWWPSVTTARSRELVIKLASPSVSTAHDYCTETFSRHHLVQIEQHLVKQSYELLYGTTALEKL